MSKSEFLKKLNEQKLDFTKDLSQYWHEYSSLHTWQWWVNLSFMVIPLIILYFKIDRKKVFLICFYGFSFHTLVAYVDIYMNSYGYWSYPHFLVPFLSNFALNSSFIPIAYMLVFQYCLNQNKNYYFYSLITSLIFGFLFAGTLQLLGLFKLSNGMNNFYVFLVDYGIALLSYWASLLFLRFQQKS
ncbi:hypothetical protein EJF36_12310 [Bacillus sp. HMF5848]|uniref:hypothetical protein n=1 Tax=Bacillus sp. HMF5848 TaxID=2495421 RepID=UPI000F767B05|nr:hypothetical protein [Bacillus sp. HMF5848]RSK27598.1 hypothetical protein EJF36_12310 [Bacillus sp. HMF5848]